ncbi:MAG: peptidylprolyl isomerase [Candidatus Firestonebacteria bacterium]|nr:peptidylprolyl isomerase [Candidatus Firestonebacteria bacterium]
MKRNLKLCFIFLFSIFLLNACKKSGEKDAASEGGSQNTEGAIAVIGKTAITPDEFQKKFNTVPPQFAKFFSGEEGKKRFLDQVIREKLFIEKALLMGIDNKPEIKKNIEDMKNNILVKELYDMKTEEFNNLAKVNDQDIENEIKSNNIASARHILIKDEKKAQTALKRVQKGESIEKLAEELSEDPTAKRNKGDLGTFGRGEMVPEFDAAVFALKVGEVTANLVKTSFGFHIIKRVEPDKETLKNTLSRKKQGDLFVQWMEGLIKEFTVKINEDVLKNVKLENAGGMDMMQGMPSGHGAVAPAEAGGVPAGHPQIK